MRAIVNTPSGRVPVEIQELPEPELRPNEALVAVQAFSLNRGELRLLQLRPDGWRPGQDIAGVVLHPAADGSGPIAGARVVALTDQGGWAERVAVPSHRIAELADNVSFAAAAALPVAGLTALRCLRHGAPLLGRRVLVTGAAGGVGNVAVQIGVRSGASVTAVVGSPERAPVVDGLGAEAIVTATDKAEGRFSLVLESVGGASLKAAIERVEPRGTVVIYGNSSGQPTPISFRDFADHANARIQSFSYFTSEPEDRFAPDLALLAGLVADGSLRPRIVEYGWDELTAAGLELHARRIAGKAVFHIKQA